MKYKSLEDRIVDVVAIIIVALVAICCVYPIVYCVSMSLSGDEAIVKHSVTLWPIGFSFESYKMVLEDAKFVRSLMNSVLYTAIGTILSLSCNLCLGYVLSRKRFVFRRQLTVFILIPMFFGGGLIPSYLLVKSLGLYNTMWAIVIPGAVSIWNSILAKTFFMSTIPDDVIDSSIIDGANDFMIFFRIVLPLSTTIIAILALYAAVGFWNDYFAALIYLKDETLQPLQLYLRNVLSAQASSSSMSDMMDTTNYISNYVNSERIKYVLIVVSTLPIIVVYPFIQRFFVKGVMLGSVKG